MNILNFKLIHNKPQIDEISPKQQRKRDNFQKENNITNFPISKRSRKQP